MPFNNGEPNTFGKELKVYGEKSENKKRLDEKNILFLAEMLTPDIFINANKEDILCFAKAVLEAEKRLQNQPATK